MLKKEHLLYRISAPDIKPKLIDPASPFLLDTAAGLIGIYSGAAEAAMPRRELEEMTSGFIRSNPDLKVASGLNKLLLDRCDFTAPAQLDYPDFRKECFLRAALLLGRREFQMEEIGKIPGNTDLYGDLPEWEKLTAFSPLSAENLLHRYNLALAQGLLFYATSLTVTLKSPDPAELRKFFKAVKFFRLLAHFSSAGKDLVKVEISGPYAIFGATGKYALNLANILPAIVKLNNWKLSAVLKFKERQLTMKLSDKNRLVSHYRELAGFIPPEIRLYHQSFNDKQQQWQIIGDAPFIDGGKQEIVFPDLSFISRESGNIFHVELFHRWHAAQLTRRIAMLTEHPELPLLLGIDRALVKDEAAFDSLFAHAPQIREKCWLFRDFPGVTATVNALKKAEKALQRTE
ncbi:MAG: DUF790 family protein [Lentisphaeria bacterium]|nr:DUF790 family protein [Lentisphaeria bacterium]